MKAANKAAFLLEVDMKKIIPLLDIKVDGEIRKKGEAFDCEDEKADKLVKKYYCKEVTPEKREADKPQATQQAPKIESGTNEADK